jgi:hypothetical protein
MIGIPITRGAVLRGELRVELEHVGQLVRAGKTERAVVGWADDVVADLLTEDAAEPGGHVGSTQVADGHPDAEPDPPLPLEEDAVGAGSDVAGGDAREPGVGERECDRQLSVLVTGRPHPERDHVVPVERRVEVRGRHADPAEELVGLALGIHVRDLVAALQRGDSRVAERHVAAHVLERRPDRVGHARGTGGPGQVAGLGLLALRRELLPEVGHAEGAVGAGEGSDQARLIVYVRLHHLDATGGKGVRRRRLRIAGDRRGEEATVGVVEDCADESASVCAGGAGDGDDL